MKHCKLLQDCNDCSCHLYSDQGVQGADPTQYSSHPGRYPLIDNFIRKIFFHFEDKIFTTDWCVCDPTSYLLQFLIVSYLRLAEHSDNIYVILTLTLTLTLHTDYCHPPTNTDPVCLRCLGWKCKCLLKFVSCYHHIISYQYN